jgi:hypothetical protein
LVKSSRCPIGAHFDLFLYIFDIVQVVVVHLQYSNLGLVTYQFVVVMGVVGCEVRLWAWEILSLSPLIMGILGWP